MKTFGKIIALNELSFTVKQGEIYGLIGPNGAGKTTALRILATLIKPSSGLARIFGLDVERKAFKIRKIISYLPEEAGAYKNLSGWKYLEFMANFYSLNKKSNMVAVKEAAKISGLGDRLKDKVKTYSKGMGRRLLIARALMMKPKLAILDESTSGLDVVHAFHIRQIIKQYMMEHDVTFLISSHNMLEVDFLCTRVAFIDNGQVIEEGSPEEIKSSYNAENLEVVFRKATGHG